MAGDVETGVTIHRTVKELDAGPIAAQALVPRSRRTTTRATSTRGRRSSPPTCSTTCSPTRSPRSARSPRRASRTRAKIEPDDRDPRSRAAGARARRRRPRALTAHRRARELHGRPRHRLARAGRRGRVVRAPRGAARRAAAAWSTKRGCAVSGKPGAAGGVSRFSCGSSRTARTPTGRSGRRQRLDERDRALAQRLAFGAVQRVRTLDHAIETLGRRPVRKLDPPVRAALRLGAYQLGFVDGVPRYAAVNESVELVRGAGLERAVAFTNAVLRRLADGIEPLLAALPEETAQRGRAQALVPGLGRRDVVARPRRRGRARAHARPERAGGARRAARARRDRRRADRRPRRLARRRGSTRTRSRRAGSGRRAARRSSSGSRSARARASGRSTSARRRAARRRCSQARSSRSR